MSASVRSQNNNVPVNNNNYAPAHHNENYRQYETDGSGFVIFILIVIFCCLCCRGGGNDDKQQHFHDEHTPMARAYPVQTESCPPSNNPVFNEYGTHENRGSGAGTAIASGLGGLAAGAIIGDMIGRNRAEVHNARQFGGNLGGGYNVAGDSGGYDIVGDSGADGGFDIQGDS